MWPQSSSVNAVNLAEKITTIPDILKFYYWIIFMVALYIVPLTLLQHFIFEVDGGSGPHSLHLLNPCLSNSTYFYVQ